MSAVGEDEVADRLDRYRACDTEDLVETYRQMVALSRVARAEASAILGVLDERQVWAADGCVDMVSWIAASESIRRANAASVLAVAKGIARLPHCAAAAGRGELSADQAVELVRIADPDTDEHWAAQAPACSPAELARLAKRTERAKDADASDTFDRRCLRWRNDARSGALLISGRLPAEEGGALTKVLSAMAEDMADPADGFYEPYPARCADALVALASAKANELGEFPRTLVVLHVGADALRRGGDGFAQDEHGVALAPEVARRIACDAKLAIVLEDQHGVGLGVGRTSRTAPPWLARLVGERDSHACRFPGCGRRRGTQLHHLSHWADGGPTDLANLATLCLRHHHLVHEQGWTLSGDPNRPGGLRIVRPNGVAYEPWATTLRPGLGQAIFAWPDNQPTTPIPDPGPPDDPGSPGQATGPPPGMAGP
jgi:hypothetical protein